MFDVLLPTMIRKLLFIVFAILALSPCSKGQTHLGLLMPEGTNRISVPFTFVNNLIVIPVTINGQITVKFILDTGANNPILTEKAFGDIIQLDYDRSINIAGAGSRNEVSALVVNDVALKLPKGISGRYIPMLVLDQDFIELKKNLGEDVYGIIGYDVFHRFVVEINYAEFEITFYKPGSFRPKRRHKEFNLELEDTKPYMDAVVMQGDEKDTVRLMIDTGASHSLLLDIEESNSLTPPDTSINAVLGHGLAGEIYGRVGRYEKISLGDYELKDILVSIPNTGAYNKSIKRGSRHGTIGGQILLHFNVIFDYASGKIYLEKNSNFHSPFRYDMSGLTVAYFDAPERYEVTGIMDDSPASNTNLQVGDVIVNMNGHHVKNSRLTDINTMLRSRPGRRIKITYERKGKRHSTKFNLKELI